LPLLLLVGMASQAAFDRHEFKIPGKNVDLSPGVNKEDPEMDTPIEAIGRRRRR